MATDQEIRDAGFKYVPQQKYLLNPFELPENQEPVINSGIVNTNAFTGGGGGGGGGFSVFNPDPNSIVNREYRPNYDFRQDREINSKTFNPKRLGGAQMPDELGVSTNTIPLGNNRISSSQLGINLPGGQVQNAYTRARNAMNIRGDDTMSRDYPGFTAAEVARLTNNSIQDYRQNYGAQGQYQSDNYYDPRYSSVTEAQKFMDNFPEYYNEPPPSKMEGILKALPYVGTLTRGAKFLGDQISPYLPVNRRSILENELGGKGIMINDIGQIVQGEGAYDTAGNIMSGYNASRMTAKTFDDRIASLGNMTPEGRAKRTAAIEAAKADFLNAQKTTDEIYDFEESEKEKKKKDTIVGRFITKRNEKKAIKAAKDDEIAKDVEIAKNAAAAGTGGGRSYDAPGGVRSSDYNQAANVASGGGGDRARNAQGQTAREATYDGNKNTGTSQGYSQHYARGGRAGYFFGGRVGFKNGGLASIL